ncbi:protein NLP1-like [Ananas comosus]|uniref:Protein NLP1-like n=1 Tax=Ananas comosus TaxID=4615 RepID=A0A6P5FE30_ANACO|nr:protein NLP1-like [Ananas comosus]XP_020094191.1 protein NLP1-like [Ananas comosus]XP_020094192.1 protein NLP1-like [Ananas comosus]XP_020094193.1 protein NLP1-like [Ananas comosus]XP_020094194.1 protein NLP1-like [Ananas comosus]
MEDTALRANSLLGHLVSETVGDLDLIDELLSASDFLLQPDSSTSTSLFNSSAFSPAFEISDGSPNPILPLSDRQEEESEKSAHSTSTTSTGENQIPPVIPPAQANELVLKSPQSDLSMSSWFQPGYPIASVTERLNRALDYIKRQRRDGDFLVQVWVPTTIGDRQVLTTCGQPFLFDANCERLMNYRLVSMKYQFSADENSNEALGLPGRVFLRKVPEWTPDVRYFDSHEYPRVIHALYYDIRGSIALPIFERDSRSCLGVVELVMTTQKVNYSSELESICNALQAVDLASSETSSVARVKVNNNSYLAAIPEIQGVLKTVCDTHKLPLAQTWISCIQQGKRGSRHTKENYKDCISTVDAACYIRDLTMAGFHQACSEHHLLRGQGVAGNAFMTNQPCFFSDITDFKKTEYPLSHHAKLFNLKAAVAIRLRSVFTGNADFVLEFFLPIDCIDSEEQKLMLNSLSITIQQVCKSLRVVTAKEMKDEALLEASELRYQDFLYDKAVPSGEETVGVSDDVSSWITNIMETQQKRVQTAVSSRMPVEFNKQDNEGFSITTRWDPSEVVLPGGNILSGFEQNQDAPLTDATNWSTAFPSKHSHLTSEKAAEKRRTKTEKTVSLQELRKHFAGSLKDAAKNLGVCPTTLKRICRQHGITRWPSRKIKKVGHSLKKLQVVINSVQGPEGTFQLSSLYESFTKSGWSDKDLHGNTSFPTLKDLPESSKMNQLQEGTFTSHTSEPNSLSSSSCSQSSSSSLGCSSGIKQYGSAPQLAIKQENEVENLSKQALNQVELQVPTEETPVSTWKSQTNLFPSEHQPVENRSTLPNTRHDSLKVKAIYGDEKIIIRLQPNWGFYDLKHEILKRFNIAGTVPVDLKYLDDESEWVLLTCDADLKECVDVYKSLSAHAIKISVNHAAQPNIRASFGHTGLS